MTDTTLPKPTNPPQPKPPMPSPIPAAGTVNIPAPMSAAVNSSDLPPALSIQGSKLPNPTVSNIASVSNATVTPKIVPAPAMGTPGSMATPPQSPLPKPQAMPTPLPNLGPQAMTLNQPRAAIPTPAPTSPLQPQPSQQPWSTPSVLPPKPQFPPLSTTPSMPSTLSRPAASVSPISAAPSVLPARPVPSTPSPTTLPPAQPIPAAAISAKVKQSPFRFLPYIIGAILVIALGGFVVSQILNAGKSTSLSSTGTGSSGLLPTNQPVTLTYWGLWEDSAALQGVLSDFEKANPGIKVNYQQQSYKDYRQRLQTAIAQQRGPDIFRFHATWTPMLRNELSPVPSSVMSGSEYQNTFYPVTLQQLVLNSQIMGVPLMYDGLALFYNEDALRTAGAVPPTNWGDLKTLASKLTIRGANGQIQRAGIAMGTANNVDHFSDIIGLLMLQNGANFFDPTTRPALDTMSFYTGFSKTDKVWDNTFPNSTLAFSRGDVAMIFAPSWEVHTIKAMSPNLKFSLAPVPQLSANKVTWATYWAEGVSAQSTHKNEAWQLIKYLSTPDVMRKLYADESKERTFGEIYSRKDMAAELATDPYVSSYLSDAPAAQGWYLSSATQDPNGIDEQIIQYYHDAVNSVLGGGDVSQAMGTVSLGTTQTLQKYGVSAPVK